MSFRPEDYPGEKPVEWYEGFPGQIVGHVSLLRDMLEPDYPDDPECRPGENDIPKICFSIGSWEDGQWVNGITGGEGVVLSLNEHAENPTVLLGDYREFEQNVNDPEGSIDISRNELCEFPLKRIGFILGAVGPAEVWNDNE